MGSRRRTWKRAAALFFSAMSALHGCSNASRGGGDAGVDAGDIAGHSAVVDASFALDASDDAGSGDVADAVDASDAGDGAAPRPFQGHQRVLHVGDSTVGYASGLQLEFKRMFPDAGMSYVSHTMTSAGLHTVAEDRIVEKLVKRHSPDLVIIQLGTNNLTVPHPEAYLGDIKSILSQIGGRACYWIGPISIKYPERGMRGVLRDNVAPCIFYDSYDLMLERQPDGLHPSQKAAIFWSNAFFDFAAKNPAPPR